MKRKLTLLLCITIPLAFALGYQQGKTSAFNEIINSTPLTTNKNDIVSKTAKHNEHKWSDDANKNSSHKTSANLTSDIEKTANHTKKIEMESESKLPEKDSGVLEMLTFLLKISASNTPEDIELFSPALNLLKHAVKEDPENLQILIDYFLQAESDSRAPYYITSILQGADLPDKDYILVNLVQSLGSMGTANANTKMLHLVSSTGIHHENPQITENLKNIAIYNNEINENRLYALDLLMPFQLKEEEKQKVVNDFKSSVVTASSEEKSFYIENIIRFSSKNERNQLAASYLENTNDFATRVAILSTLHNGSVRPDNELKQQLFKIAQDPNDPLTRHAKDALLYVFEINNQEYQTLISGGG